MLTGPSNEPLGLDASHIRYLHDLLTKLGVRGADAHDIAQTVLLSAHRAAGGFRGAATAKTWLYRICVRAVMLHRQQLRPRTLVLLPDVEAPSRGETPLEELLAKERALVLQEHLRVLSPEQLSVWALHDIEGLTMREVAERLDCPLQTAYSRLRVARQAIELKVLELEDAS